MSTRAVYRGTRHKLVVAFDVGTTYSSISYSVLEPGQVPEIKWVTRFPAHEHISDASTIPTVIYYDQSGKVRAVGAEAMKEDIYDIAEDENWVKAEWFKLHLSSKVGAGQSINNIPPLPLNKTAVEVFADFLKYLLECTSSYIQDTHPNGPDLWNFVKFHIDFVLSHPNGWEDTQQSEMRKAAVLAELVPDNPSGHFRLSFVTEGEASLHFCIQNGLLAEAMENDSGVVIVDAGSGTINISSYSRNPHLPKESCEDLAPPQCHFHGSIFVTLHARCFLESYLADSPYLEDLEHIVRCFDKTTKLRFRKVEEPQYIKFGSTRDKDDSCNIRFGQLKLMGSDVAQFFQPSVDCIVKSVLEQKTSAYKTISHVALVGEFAASDWLFTKVHDTLTPLGLNIVRPDKYINQTVSDGAISFYLDHFVGTRGPRHKLVVAFDVGTIYSSVSYSILEPGQVPEIKWVTRFSAHEQVSDASTIPTVIYYDQSGKVRAVGAEAMKEDIYDIAEDENWVKAEWFKLHLKSKVGAGQSINIIPPLPLNKTAVEVFADFLKYLLECTSNYIQDTHPNGPDLWSSVKSHICFVLSHPNGWEDTQQSEMRKAAVLAGLVPDNPSGHFRLLFVTEGEASLHFCIQNGLLAEAMENDSGVVIVDAGSGTINISSYSRNPSLLLKESCEKIAPPQYYSRGSSFVSFLARQFLKSYLIDSPYLDDLDHIVNCFDKTTNLRFGKAEEPQYVKFGSIRDNDESHNIRFGQLKLIGSDVAQFFQPSIDCIVHAVLEQKKTARKMISYVVLVGEFAASDWLFTQVHDTLAPCGLNIVRPNKYISQTVSNGAISFYLDHFCENSRFKNHT